MCDLGKLPTFGLNFHLKSGFDLQILLFTFIQIKVIHFVKDKIVRLGADTESLFKKHSENLSYKVIVI